MSATLMTIGAIMFGASEAGQVYLGGRQQRSAYKSEAIQLETQMKAIKTNAAIEQEDRMRKLKETLSMQNAVFAMRGQTTGVGSANVIQAASMSEANRDAYYQNLQKDFNLSVLRQNVWSAREASRRAMQNAIVSKHFELLSKAGRTMMMGSYGGGS